MVSLFYYDSPIGRLGIAEKKERIVGVLFDKTQPPRDAKIEETSLIREAWRQMREYFGGKRRSFELPIAVEGNDFEKTVWTRLLDIPYGKTCSYMSIARQIGSKLAARAVGRASGTNPIPVIIPCHRVVGMRGGLVGYSGGLEKKKFLLKLEKGFISG